jgi:hypothetical protein
MPEGMSGFRLGRVSKKPSDIRVTFDIGYSCEIKVATVRLRLAGKRFL